MTGTGPSQSGKPEAMISADGVTDSGLLGDGTIDGSGADPAPATADNPQGRSWWQLAADAKSDGGTYPGFPDIPSSNGLPRPWLVEFHNSRNIVVQGVLLTNSPMWNLALRYDTSVLVTGLRVFNNPDDPTGAPNTDGIDPVGSTHLLQTRLDIDTGDDNVAMKSGLPGIPAGAYYQAPYNLPRRPLRGVTITDSVFRRGHGMSVGSETVNGVTHIRANRVRFIGTGNGFRIKTGRDRGNEIADMVVRNLDMQEVTTPLSLSEYYPTIPGVTQGDIDQPQPPETRPHVHDIVISDVEVRNIAKQTATGGLFIGLPEAPIENLTLRRVHMSMPVPAYLRLRNVSHVTCQDVTVTPANPSAPAYGHVFDNEGGVTNANGCDVSPTPASP